MSIDFHALESIFHEPSRLAIMSELCGAADGLSFTDLKSRCSLTDGNLSRHLQTLEKAKVVRIDKRFIESKPRTTLFVTQKGREHFLDYLAALEQVLQSAAAKAQQERPSRGRKQLNAAAERLFSPKKAR